MKDFPTMPNEPGDRLRQAREAVKERRGRRMTQREIAGLLGLNEDTYRSYEYGKSELPEAIARQAATILGRSWRWFYEGGNDVSIPEVPVPDYEIPVPYIGHVGANAKFDWTDPLDSEEFQEVPSKMAEGSARFCCRIIGDSCMDLIHPGDLCIFQKEFVPRLNSMVIHRSPDGRVTLKQLKHDGTNFILHPLNAKYPDEIADGDCLGFLVGIIREENGDETTRYNRKGIRP